MEFSAEPAPGAGLLDMIFGPFDSLPVLWAQGGAPDWAMFVPIAAIAVLFYFLFIRTERKQREKHRAMVDALKKGDRVVTIGGIKGSVVSVRKDADEVLLKVDENVRIRITVGAVARVEGTDAAEEKPAS